VNIEILGQSFRISTDEEISYVTKLVEHYRELTNTIQQTTSTSNTHLIAILAGLLAVDEYFKAEKAFALGHKGARMGVQDTLLHSSETSYQNEEHHASGEPKSAPLGNAQPAENEALQITHDILSKIEEVV